MAKPENGTFLSEILAVGLYKRSQGRLSRQLTAGGLGALVLVGVYILSLGPLLSYDKPVRVGIPVAVAALAGWIIFRLVNYPKFAEFLISVEGEMAKVSWAGKEELYRATIVIISVMAFLAVVLHLFDITWLFIFKLIGVLQV